MKSFIVYKCASSSYISETCCHFKSSIEEHTKKENKSHIFKHLHSTTTCFDSYDSPCFKIIDKASSKFESKIKEPLHINWRKPKCTTKSFSSHAFTIARPHLPCYFLSLFFFRFSFIYYFHYL